MEPNRTLSRHRRMTESDPERSLVRPKSCTAASPWLCLSPICYAVTLATAAQPIRSMKRCEFLTLFLRCEAARLLAEHCEWFSHKLGTTMLARRLGPVFVALTTLLTVCLLAQ